MDAAKACGVETRPSDKQDVFLWKAGGVSARRLIQPQPDVAMKPPYFIQQQIKAEAQTSVLRRHLSNSLLLISVLYPRRSNLSSPFTPERRPRDVNTRARTASAQHASAVPLGLSGLDPLQANEAGVTPEPPPTLGSEFVSSPTGDAHVHAGEDVWAAVAKAKPCLSYSGRGIPSAPLIQRLLA